MPELQKSEALILSAIRWHESSKIVTLYAREWGKIKVIARGALRRNSPFGGKLESLNHVEVIISKKSSRALQILTDLTLKNGFEALKVQFDRMPYALAMLEFIQKTFEDQQSEPVFFDFLITLIRQLEEGKYPEVVFWYFLLKVCSFLGFKPTLDHCRSCGDTALLGTVYFSLSQGEIFCDNCAGQAPLAKALHESDFRFLQKLQNYPHRRIKELAPPKSQTCDFTHLLMDYLNLHVEQTVELKSLRLLGL